MKEMIIKQGFSLSKKTSEEKMKKNLNNKHYIGLNLLSAALFVPAIEYMKNIEAGWPLITSLVFLGAVFVISFYFAYYKTGAWKFVHTPLEKLDERELKIAGSTSRISYAVFTVIALLVMLVLSLTELQINVVFTAVFIYFAHILPATIYLIVFNRSDILSK